MTGKAERERDGEEMARPDLNLLEKSALAVVWPLICTSIVFVVTRECMNWITLLKMLYSIPV